MERVPAAGPAPPRQPHEEPRHLRRQERARSRDGPRRGLHLLRDRQVGDMELTHDQIERRVRELGPWFHDLDLQGVRTAPDHFLGSYPRGLWEAIKQVVPES